MVFALLALQTCVSIGCATHGSSAAGDPVKAVRTIAVKLADDQTPARYSAIITPNAQVDLAFRVPGYIVRLRQTKGADGRIRPLEPGAHVEAGMILAQLRRSDYVAVVDKSRGARDANDAATRAAEAQIVQSQAVLTQAELDFSRVSRLWEQESITKPAYDASQATLDIARAKLVAANSALAAAREQASSASAELKEAEIALADTELRAPFGGILLRRHAELGTLVAAGTPAFTIADLHSVKCLFNVPDSALQYFREGQSLTLTIDAFPAETFQGQIVSVAASADPNVRSFQIEATVANSGLKLRSGMIAAVQVEEMQSGRGVQIPVDALVHDPIQDRYLVYGMDQRSGREYAREILVKPGPLSGSNVLILEGLEPGQKIIVTGANLLRPGDAVHEIE